MSKRVCVCVPHGGLVHPELYRGLFQMQNALGQKGYTFAYTEVDMASVAKARNMCVQACLDAYDLVHFVDNDVIMPENAAQLYEHDADIVSGLYFARQWPHTPQMYERALEERYAGKYWPITDYAAGIVEVDAVGAGCLLVKTEVFREMERSWNDRLARAADFVTGYADSLRTSGGGSAVGTVLSGVFFAQLGMRLSPWFEFTDERGEDFYFCERARQAGFRVLVDTRVKCEHLTWLRLGEGHFQDLQKRGLVKFDRERTESNEDPVRRNTIRETLER